MCIWLLAKINACQFFSFMQLKNFLEICQNFGHKHWYANSLAMNQLVTTNFWQCHGFGWARIRSQPSRSIHGISFFFFKKVLQGLLRFGV